jgi:anti-sigma regulatory factor (Ser/Thr protein kinase)
MPVRHRTEVDDLPVVSFELAAAPSSIARARHAAGAIIERQGGSAVRAAVEIVVSELVTNAVEHTSSPIALRIYDRHGFVRIEVEDHGKGWPRLEDPGPEEASGRGLLIVDHLARRWGVERRAGNGNGKTVWAELDC